MMSRTDGVFVLILLASMNSRGSGSQCKHACSTVFPAVSSPHLHSHSFLSFSFSTPTISTRNCTVHDRIRSLSLAIRRDQILNSLSSQCLTTSLPSSKVFLGIRTIMAAWLCRSLWMKTGYLRNPIALSESMMANWAGVRASGGSSLEV